jgi:hypothetical protein
VNGKNRLKMFGIPGVPNISFLRNREAAVSDSAEPAASGFLLTIPRECIKCSIILRIIRTSVLSAETFSDNTRFWLLSGKVPDNSELKEVSVDLSQLPN